MYIVCRELLTILIVAVISGVLIGFIVWGYYRFMGARMVRAIERELPRNGNGPSLSLLLRQSPRDTGTFRKIEDDA